MIRSIRTAIGNALAKPASFAPLAAQPGLEIGFRAKSRTLSVQDWSDAIAGGDREAFETVRTAAQAGDLRAQTALGHLLLSGHGTEKDQATAFGWFERAGRSGHAEAANMAGRCCELGWGVDVRPDLAAGWYRQAAETGHVWAQFNLGMLLFDGHGCERDLDQGRLWFLRAARRRHAKAMNMLGRYGEEGWAGGSRPAAAAQWYRRAAEGGDFRGQFNHARLLFGAGQRAGALQWLERSIEGGIPDFWRSVADDLAGSRDPDLRSLGQRALARLRDSAPDRIATA